MKATFLYLPAACLAIASCGSSGPMSMSTSSFDPLNAAGGTGTSSSPAGKKTFKPGEFVTALMDNTALFKKRPSGNASADRLLSRGTQMKVISDDGSYCKVELDDGQTGFVPSIQVGDNSQSMGAEDVSGDEIQVWPPVGSTIPLPPADPMPGGEADSATSAPLLPTTIDPDAPADLPPLPDDAPTPGLGSEPEINLPPMEEAPKEKAAKETKEEAEGALKEAAKPEEPAEIPENTD